MSEMASLLPTPAELVYVDARVSHARALREAGTPDPNPAYAMKEEFSKPLCIELFAGLSGWGLGAAAAGFRVVGFDIADMPRAMGQAHHPDIDYVLQDVLTIHGSQLRDASLILASPPCQNYSYLAMPWSRSENPENSKAAKALRHKWETEGPDNRLFDACFRIQREACEAAGRYIPLIVENVRGAQPWVGKAKANFGSFYLYGDVAMVGKRIVAGVPKFGAGMRSVSGVKIGGPRGDDWFAVHNTPEFDARMNGRKANPDGTNHPQGSWFRIADSSQGDRGKKVPACGDWFSDPKSTCRKHGSGSNARKMASAMIAKISFDLSYYIASEFLPS